MEIIVHRVNLSGDLNCVPLDCGVEMDVRSIGSKLIVQHDPYDDGEPLENWLQYYKHGTLVVNIKEEGLEFRVRNILEDRGIKNYFFLDQSFPFIYKVTSNGDNRCAIRVSDLESAQTALNMSSRVNWIWLDFFETFNVDFLNLKKMQLKGCKICMVSPELHDIEFKSQVKILRRKINQHSFEPDAVCTKFPDLWIKTKNDDK